MNNSNGKDKAFYDKRLNFVATGVLLLWILTIIFGIFSFIYIGLLFNMSFIVPAVNPLLYTVCITVVYSILIIIVFFASRSVSYSIINLFKNRRWKEPSKFIKGILIQFLTASIASILTIIFYKGNSFTEFFILFFSFVFQFSIMFLGCCLYYYRYDIPERRDFRKPHNVY